MMERGFKDYLRHNSDYASSRDIRAKLELAAQRRRKKQPLEVTEQPKDLPENKEQASPGEVMKQGSSIAQIGGQLGSSLRAGGGSPVADVAGRTASMSGAGASLAFMLAGGGKAGLAAAGTGAGIGAAVGVTAGVLSAMAKRRAAKRQAKAAMYTQLGKVEQWKGQQTQSALQEKTRRLASAMEGMRQAFSTALLQSRSVNL